MRTLKVRSLISSIAKLKPPGMSGVKNCSSIKERKMKSKTAFTSAILFLAVSTVSITAVAHRRPEVTSAGVSQESQAPVKHEITAVELKHRLDKKEKVTIIDSRGSVSGQTIKGAVHVPNAELDGWAKGIDKAAYIVTFCTCPHDEAAEAAVVKLRGMGFKNAFSLKGGLNAAMQAGIPTADVSE